MLQSEWNKDIAELVRITGLSADDVLRLNPFYNIDDTEWAQRLQIHYGLVHSAAVLLRNMLRISIEEHDRGYGSIWLKEYMMVMSISDEKVAKKRIIQDVETIKNNMKRIRFINSIDTLLDSGIRFSLRRNFWEILFWQTVEVLKKHIEQNGT
jgi:hypothetical protein